MSTRRERNKKQRKERNRMHTESLFNKNLPEAPLRRRFEAKVRKGDSLTVEFAFSDLEIHVEPEEVGVVNLRKRYLETEEAMTEKETENVH